MTQRDRKKLAAQSILLALVFACGPAYAGGEAEGVLQGKEIFHERCSICHGVDGVPLLPGAPEFAKGEMLEKSDEELLKSIEHGKGMMPAWEETLSKEQCKDVLSYVRVIAGNKVFDEKCVNCHHKKLPALSSDVPKNEELKNYEGILDVCKYCNVESEISKDDLVNVIKYIRTLSK